MDDIVLTIIIVFAILVFLISVIIISYNVFRKWRISKMFFDCDKVLQSLIDHKN